MSQELRRGTGEWFWHGISPEVVVRILAGAAVVWRLNWGRQIALRWLLTWLLAGGLGSPTVGLSQLSFTTASDLRNRGRGNVFPDLASEVTVCYSYDFTAGRDYPETWVQGAGNPWGHLEGQLSHWVLVMYQHPAEFFFLVPSWIPHLKRMAFFYYLHFIVFIFLNVGFQITFLLITEQYMYR